MKMTKNADSPILRIVVCQTGVIKIDANAADADQRSASLALAARLMPAISKFDEAIRKV
jgi:hypothetical protein